MPRGGDLEINASVFVPLSEVEMIAIRAQGPGGQNVNKVSSAIHLRFDVKGSSLSAAQKQRVLAQKDRRLTTDGVLVIKAQNHRTQERNKQEALERLQGILRDALKVQKRRKPTKPSYGSIRRRQAAKTRRSAIKSTRGKPSRDE